jgi:hypothetical protein
MSNQAIAAALATQLDTLNLPTQWENAPFTPTAGVTYLAEALLPGPTLSVGVAGTSSDEFGGIYQVLVYAPLGGTKGDGLAVAKDVADAFPKALKLTYDGLTVIILRTSQATAFTSGDRWVIPVSVTYRAFA